MSATMDTINALGRVADWIDAGAADDITAFVHSTAVRDAVCLIDKQAHTIAALREEINRLAGAK